MAETQSCKLQAYKRKDFDSKSTFVHFKKIVYHECDNLLHAAIDLS